MTFRASYFTVQPQSYKPWEQAQPNYLVTVLSTVVQKPSVSVPESRPTVLVHPSDIQFPNIALLNFALLQIPSVGKLLDETVPQPPSRPRDFLAPNLLIIQPYAGTPFVNQTFDRPQPVARQTDLLIPNLLVTTLSVTYGPSVAVWDSDPQLPIRRPDFQTPNLVVTAAPPVAKPVTTPAFLFDKPVAVALHIDAPFPNLLITPFNSPLFSPIFERPPVTWKPQDFSAPNIVIVAPPVAKPISPPALLFDKPVAVSLRADAPLPNLLTTPLTVFTKPVFVPVFERPLVISKPQDFQSPNLVVTAPAVIKPAAQPLYGDRPLRPQPLQDFIFPNIVLVPPTNFVFRAPLISWPAPIVRTQDTLLPNLVLRAPAAAPLFSPIFERPVAVSHPVDAPLPNLLTSTLAVAAKPFFNPIFEQSAAASPVARQPDVLAPNLLTTTLAVVYSPSVAVWDTEPQLPVRRPDFQPPNLAVLAPVVIVKPPFNLTGVERPAPAPAPQDFRFLNLLTTTLFIPPGKPFIANPFLFTDRPAPSAPPWDHPPANFLPFRPPPVVSAELHQNPFFITMGRLSQLGNLPS